MDNYILLENIRAALAIAIDSLAERESRISPTFKSTLRAGLEENLRLCQEGYLLRIK